MIVRELGAKNFRNLSEISFSPCEEVNIIYGENAQGKTNLIEALWLFTGGKSFRGAKDGELTAFGQERSELNLAFYGAQRDQTACIKMERHRQAILNGIDLPSASRLAGTFCAVVFSPVHLSLVKDGPQIRRNFLDAAICQVKPRYANFLSDYKRALLQRNALLKDLQFHSELYDLLDIWEEKLSRLGAAILMHRLNYIYTLAPISAEIYAGLSSAREEFHISYQGGVETVRKMALDEIAGLLQEELKQVRAKDIAAGTTSAGPHRDDLFLEINGISARTYGSQGQQRSCVLAMKLGEAALLEKSAGESPVVLLDDVMSELDSRRQDYVLNHIKGSQVFITCCEPTPALRGGGKAFSMANGILQPK